MKQRIRDGIIIDQSLLIKEERKIGFPYYMRLLQLFAIVAGGCSIISIFVESFLIPVSMKTIYLVLLFAGIVLFFMFYFTVLDVVKVVFAAGFYGLFWYSRLPMLKNGFYILENLVIDRMNEYYGYRTLHYKAEYSTAVQDTTLLVIMILIPIMTVIAAAIVRSKLVNICSVLMFIPVSVSFAFGLIPSEPYLITYILFMLYLVKSHHSNHHTVDQEQNKILQRVNSRAAIWLSLICLLVFTLTKLFVSPEQYDGITKIKDAKTELQTFLFDFTMDDVTKRFTSNNGNQSQAVGGLSGGILGNVDRVSFTKSEQLRVTAPLSSVAEGIYLKGYVGSDYSGDKWEGHSSEIDKKYDEMMKKMPEKSFLPVNQTNTFLDVISDIKGIADYKYSFYQAKIKVDYIKANKKYMYAPYYTNYGILNGVEYLQDLYTSPKKKKGSYEFDYFYRFASEKGSPFMLDPSIMQKVTDYSVYEKLYRDFVYSAYTSLPDRGMERLKEEFSATAVSKSEDVMEKIDYVKNYLSSNTRYSLAPGRLPEGKDFVEYFLYENKVGYCAHYATAAAMMLRVMGVPVRYVEGYAISSLNIDQNKDAGEQTVSVISDDMDSERQIPQVELMVLDSNAHAWVEVYMDGCGWVPMEFTPAAGIADTTTMAEDMRTAGEDMEETVDTQVTPTEMPKEPTSPPHSEKPDEEPVEEDVKLPEVAAPIANKQNSSSGFIILIIFTGALLTACIVIRQYLIKSDRRDISLNTRAILIYGKMEKLLTLCHALPKKMGYLEENESYIKENCPYIEKEDFESCMEIIRKARFGRFVISAGELSFVEKFYAGLFGKVYPELNIAERLHAKTRMS
ncbi:MAG: hypothetical protein K0S76_380 [Herbinix sp.]|nr:hypothetical protein [Herbinix sp.]